MGCCRAAPLTYNENWCQQKSRLAHRCRGKAQRLARRRPPSHHEQLAAPGHRGRGGWRRRPRASVVRRQPQRRRCPRPARPHRWCRRGRRLVRAALSLGLHDHLPHGGLRERQLHMRRVRCSEAHQPAIREPLLRGHLRRPTDQPAFRAAHDGAGGHSRRRRPSHAARACPGDGGMMRCTWPCTGSQARPRPPGGAQPPLWTRRRRWVTAR